jgi:hypothetical protein
LKDLKLSSIKINLLRGDEHWAKTKIYLMNRWTTIKSVKINGWMKEIVKKLLKGYCRKIKWYRMKAGK